MKCPVWVLCLLFGCTGLAQAAVPSPSCLDPRQASTPISDLTGPLPAPDYLDSVLRCAQALAPPPRKMSSAWVEMDSRQYETKLSQSRFAWLVLPAQTQYYGFDRTERALIGAEVADALGPAASLPDTFLVARALGETRRRFDGAAVVRLANAVGATQLIEIHAGHDGKMNMTLTLQLKTCAANAGCKLVRKRDWRVLPFSDERPPFLVVRSLQSDIRRDLLGLPPLTLPATPEKRSGNPLFNVTTAALVSGPVADSAAAAAILAALVPAEGEYGRERLSAWALRTALRAGNLPEQRFLASYAAADLSRRPYAIKLLEGLDDPAANTLRHLLDGNLTEAQSAIKSVQAPLSRLLLAMNIHTLGAIYDRKLKFNPKLVDAAFGSAASEWRPLVDRRAGDHDTWALPNSVPVKVILDATFPVPALSLRSVEQGSLVLRARDAGDIDTANLRHVRAALTRLKSDDCCGRAKGAHAAWQVYWLLEAAAEANVITQMRHQMAQQGLPEEALRLLAMYDPFLAGHPQFEYMRKLAAAQMLESAPPDRAAHFERMLDDAEMSIAQWEQGQSEATRYSVHRGARMVTFADAYSRDFPRRPFWPMPMWRPSPEEAQLSCVSLAYSVSDLNAAEECVSQTAKAEQPKLLAALRLRFHGYPVAEQVFAERAASATAAGAPAADPASLLRARIRKDPDVWEAYQSLGVLLVSRDGKYAEAQKIYLSYPPFKSRADKNRVEYSNYAYDAGSHLYWRGQPDLAKPLYEIASALDTGSEASVTSDARLALLKGDYQGALDATTARAMRYASPYAFRDYLSLLHVMGRGEKARDAFPQVAELSDNPQAWIGALVGDRMSGGTYEQMKTWVLTDDIRTSQHRGQRFAPWYAMLWMTTDRQPNADFPRLMSQIERDSPRTVGGPGVVMRPERFGGRGHEGVGASGMRSSKAPWLKPGSTVKSEYVLLADALSSFHAADYAAAATKFATLADFYPIERDFTEVALPYFAFAAAKTGDKAGLERFMEALPNANDHFDVWLGRAFFAAVRRDSGKAAAALERAFNIRPNTDFRPIMSEYQYAEACEIARRETGDARFDRMIVDWARKHQRIQPTHAWAYAMEAQYSGVAADVNRALAMTIYLDPASPRLQKFTAAQKSAAAAWLRTNKPFAPKPRVVRERVTQLNVMPSSSAP